MYLYNHISVGLVTRLATIFNIFYFWSLTTSRPP